jgi:hypothetical protein
MADNRSLPNFGRAHSDRSPGRMLCAAPSSLQARRRRAGSGPAMRRRASAATSSSRMSIGRFRGISASATSSTPHSRPTCSGSTAGSCTAQGVDRAVRRRHPRQRKSAGSRVWGTLNRPQSPSSPRPSNRCKTEALSAAEALRRRDAGILLTPTEGEAWRQLRRTLAKSKPSTDGQVRYGGST